MRSAAAEAFPEILLPKLWPHQKTFVDDPAQFTVCKSATKCGKTMAAAWWLADQIMRTPGGLFWWVGPTNEVGLIGYLAVLHFLDSILYKKQERPWKLKTTTGAACALKTAQEPDLLRGPGVMGMVLDEAGTPVFDKAWGEIRTTISATKGRLKIIGNPGDAGQFLDKAEKYGKDPYMPEWSYHQWKYLDRPGTTEEELEQIKRELGEDSTEFRRYYLAETIHGSGSFFHNLDAVAKGKREEPIKGVFYILGVDPCIRSDYFVATVWRTDERRQVCYSRYKGTPPEQQEEEIDRLARLYNDAPIVIEDNGPGAPIARQLMKRGRAVYPFNTSMKSKPVLLYDYQSDIAHSAIILLDDEIQMQEHLAYQSRSSRITGVEKLGAPHGMHDDLVMANALANNGLRRCVSLEVLWAS